MKIIECDQYSDAWWQARCGVPTASNAGKIFTSQSKASTSMSTYIYDLISEQFDPDYGMVEKFQTAAMKNGSLMEPRVRSCYEFETGNKVTEVGFCLTDDGRFGCSPDGLVGDDGGVECKCPQHNTQIEYLLGGDVPAKYIPQVHWSLVVTGRAYWDFISYCPGLPHLLVRVEPNDYTKRMSEAMDKFWTKYQEQLLRIKKLAGEDEPVVEEEVEEPVMF